MSTGIPNIDLFKTGAEFNQIQFLDGFYENINLDEVQDEEIAKLLMSGVDDSNNSYVKRSSFKILCDLTLCGIIKNRFATLGVIQKGLLNGEDALQIIALKYFPFFSELDNKTLIQQLKELSDNSNGEIASQSFFSLGIIELTKIISGGSVIDLVLNCNTAKSYFQGAFNSSENRDDAQFYIHFIEWTEAVFSNDLDASRVSFEKIEGSIKRRILYDFDGQDLELDFIVFRLTNEIKETLNTASTALEWTETLPQIELLLKINQEIVKIKSISSKNTAFTEKLFESIFGVLQSSIYSANLLTERKRLNILYSQSENNQLKDFIDYLISVFPDNTEIPAQNNELLALLVEGLGRELGLMEYEKITNKSVSTEVIKSLSDLLRRHNNNALPFRTGSIIGQEVLISIMNEIDSLLPNYPIEKHQAFFNILEELIRYTRNTLVGHTKKHYSFLFSEPDGKGQTTSEQDLQDDMIAYFEHSKIADGISHEQAKFVDGGRVDILYKKDIITIPIELKKSSNRPDKADLEKNYIAQAQTYTSGYDQLGIFVLLELSDKSKESPPNFKDWFKVHHLQPSSNLSILYPDYIVSIVIPGNRTSPSEKSTYK